jgi:iron(III) transport system permease protein
MQRFNTLAPAYNLPWRAFQRYMPGMPRLSWLKLVSAGIIAITSLPMLYLLLRASASGQAGIDYLLQARTLSILGNSLLLTVAVVAISGLIGVPFAWLTTRANLPLRRLWLVLGLMPMVIPSYIGALTFLAAFGPVGYLQQLLGVARLPEIYGFAGACAVITLFTYPYFVLPVRAALLNSDACLEEAAQSLGFSRWRVFLRVTLPLLRPAIAAGALLTALYTLSDFGAVMVMRYNTFTRAIYVTYNSSFDRNRAALLALLLVALTLVLVWLAGRATDGVRSYRAGTGVSRRPKLVPLGRWQIPALLFCALLVAVGVVLPVGVLLGWALNPNVTSPIDLKLGEISWNAAASSLLAALVAGAAALPLAMLARRAPMRFSRALVSLSYLGNALPGVVVGLALVFFAANAVPALYQTLPILTLGYVVRFLPYGVASTRSALAGINPCLEEAGQSLGLNSWQTLTRITAPLARSGVIAGIALVFLNTMKELPITLMLAPIGFHTLATRVWSSSESGMLALVGLPGLALIAVSCVGLAILLQRDHQ